MTQRSRANITSCRLRLATNQGRRAATAGQSAEPTLGAGIVVEARTAVEDQLAGRRHGSPGGGPVPVLTY